MEGHLVSFDQIKDIIGKVSAGQIVQFEGYTGTQQTQAGTFSTVDVKIVFSVDTNGEEKE